MARQRFIWPDLWTDPGFGKLSERERLLFIGMFSNADDEGRLLGDPAVLRSAIFPYDDLRLTDIKTARDAIASKCRSVKVYVVENIEYVALIQWKKWQHPKYPKPSNLPAPPRRKSSKNHENPSPNPPEVLEESSPNTDSWVGLGREGLDRDGMEDPAPALPEPRKPRPPDHVWDTLCVLFGTPSNDVERDVRNTAVKLVKQSLKAEETSEWDGVDVIVARASNWTYKFPRLTLTATALAKHWTALGRPDNNGSIPRRKTGWRWVRGEGGGNYRRDPNGMDQPPPAFLASVKS